MSKGVKCLFQYAASALLLCCTVGGPKALGQELRVRVIDAKTGQPIVGKRLHIALDDGKPQDHSRFLDAQSRDLKTGRDGAVTLHLKPPLRKQLTVILAVGWWTQCSPDFYPLEVVLRSGIVAKNDCKTEVTNQREYTARPGEIVVFTRRISFLERLKRFPG